MALRHPLTLPGYLPSLAMSFSYGLLAPILPLYVLEFEVSYGLVGLALAGEGVGAILGDLPAGWLLGRLRSKRTMLLGIILTMLSIGILFWAPSIPVVLVFRLLAGFGRALWAIARHAYIAEAIPVAGRGKSVALFGGIFRFGRFVGPAIGGTVAAAYGLRVPFLVSGVIVIGAVAAVAFSTDPQRDSVQEETHSSGRNGPLATLRANLRTLATAGMGQFFAQMVRAGRRAIIPLYAADVLGLDAQAIGLIDSISALADVALFYPAGMIMDHYGRKYAVVPAFFIQAFGVSLIPFTGSFAGLALTAALIGLGNGLSAGTMLTLGADLSPPDDRAKFLGIWRLVGDAGATGGPLIVGGVADLLSLHAAGWATSLTGLAAGSIFLFLVPETLRRDGQGG
jgi:MFS family permease